MILFLHLLEHYFPWQANQAKPQHTAQSCGGKGMFSATLNVGWLSGYPDKVLDLITSR